MTVYDTRRGESTADQLMRWRRRAATEATRFRAWWVHLALAVAATSGALAVCVLEVFVSPSLVPQTVENLAVMVPILAWCMYSVKRREAKDNEAREHERVEHDARIREVKVILHRVEQEQAALRRMIAEHRKRDGFAEGWLACSSETPVLDQEPTVPMLRPVRAVR
jgi:hypothetical protein